MRPAAAVLSCLLVSLGSAASAQAPGLDLGAILGSPPPTGPGCVAGVARPGASVVTAAYGMADLEHPEPLTPSFADGFTTSLRGVTTFVFERTAGGRVTGFSVWANGVRGLVFARD